jgi:hypothetical protein
MRPVMFFGAALALGRAEDPAEFFESKIRPLFASNCLTCHAKPQMGGLRLDSRDTLLAGGNSGPAVVPGQPEASLLVQAVRRTHARLKMPPTGPLSAGQVALIERWVELGAPWPAEQAKRDAADTTGLWSLRPIRKPAPPPIRDSGWAVNDVDRFILAKLEQKGLQPVATADRSTWLRRVTLDLTGFPPTPEEVRAFLEDKSSLARANAVDRLLDSPHYGERWGRHWLDLARYSDGQLAAGVDTPLPNSYRFRDWVVEAFNEDLPYDRFVKAQIAADLLGDPTLMPGLGFQALARNADDQVDVTTKVFLGLTVGCAQCHDHKYDPIPTRDYYSLLGVFRSSQMDRYPLVPQAEVERYEAIKKKIDALTEVLDDYLIVQQKQLVDHRARRTARYMVAAWMIANGAQPDRSGLEEEVLQRWARYLSTPDKDHQFLRPWFDLMASKPPAQQVIRAAEDYQAFVLKLLDDAREVDDKNYVAFGGRKGMKDERTRQYTNIVSLPVLHFYQWRELASGPYNIDGHRAPAGIYYSSPKETESLLASFHKEYVDQLRGEVAALEKRLPPMYPFLHAIKDGPKPADVRVAIRGDGKNPGEVAPRRFLSALCEGEPMPFRRGSGRLELAEAIVNPSNPLTARVMVNRIWQHHFGHGIVRTPSNFGSMGEPPSHPELLDFLASRFIESGWSVKAIHRLLLVSNTYGLSARRDPRNEQADPDNRLLWRANLRHRLDLEALRDSMLAVSGTLDRTIGGLPEPLGDVHRRRSLYLTVSRTRLDATMALFDFPDANATADERPVTAGPLQGLYFLNSNFVRQQAGALDQRLIKEAGREPHARIERAYQLLYGRPPDAEEIKLGIEYVAKGDGRSWQQYLQALLGSAEFTSVN